MHSRSQRAADFGLLSGIEANNATAVKFQAPEDEYTAQKTHLFQPATVWNGLTQIDSVQNILGSKLYAQLHNLPSCRHVVGLHEHTSLKNTAESSDQPNAKHRR